MFADVSTLGASFALREHDYVFGDLKFGGSAQGVCTPPHTHACRSLSSKRALCLVVLLSSRALSSPSHAIRALFTARVGNRC
jgi:hypothetical protein